MVRQQQCLRRGGCPHPPSRAEPGRFPPENEVMSIHLAVSMEAILSARGLSIPSISPLPKIFPHPDRVVSSPGAVGTQVGRAQVAVARPESAEKKVLGYPHLKALPNVDASSPGLFHADRVKRPGVKRLRKVFAEQKARFPKQKHSPQLSAAEGACLHIAGEHVARKGIAGGIGSSANSSIRSAEVRVNLVVRRRQIELPIAPEHVVGKKHPL